MLRRDLLKIFILGILVVIATLKFPWVREENLLHKFVRDIKDFVMANPGSTVTCCDNPQELKFGYLVKTPSGESKLFEFRINGKAINEANPEISNLLRTTAGRMNLAKALQGST